MLRSARIRRSTIDVRRCLACGFGGHAAQRPERPTRRQERSSLRRDVSFEQDTLVALPHCPRCGCDFRVRPPRSYAEMEGLDQIEADDAVPRIFASDGRLVERWIAFLFGAVLVCVVAGSLIAAVLTSFPGFGA